MAFAVILRYAPHAHASNGGPEVTPSRAARALSGSGSNVSVDRAVPTPPFIVAGSRPAEGDDVQFPPGRDELAGFPIVGGNSDIGVQFGGAATLTRFRDALRPYLWNIDLLLSASAKSDQGGLRLVQQSHVLRLDAPQLLGGRVRLDARGTFQRTINAGYFGVGNATIADPAQVRSRRYQFLQEEAWLRAITRVHTRTALDVTFSCNVRYEAPRAYTSSKLAEDLAGPAPAVVGGSPALLAALTAGFIVDTRDSEFVTRRGVSYQLALSANTGTAEDVAYGEAAVLLTSYAPLAKWLIFASRFFASFRFGRVPFYDLQLGGTFEPESMIGSDGGVRGVPLGRFAGLIKALVNTEIRSTPFPRVHLFGQSFRVGTTTFVDAGRVWSDYHLISAADGRSLGLKYGVGGGLFVQWGEAAIFRVEVAYSPDAVSENPDFPVGIYVADGLTF